MIAMAQRTITIRVLNVKGSLLMQQQASIEKMINKGIKMGLTTNGAFVILQQKIA